MCVSGAGELGAGGFRACRPCRAAQGLSFPGETEGHQAVGSRRRPALGLWLGQTSHPRPNLHYLPAPKPALEISRSPFLPPGLRKFNILLILKEIKGIRVYHRADIEG